MAEEAGAEAAAAATAVAAAADGEVEWKLDPSADLVLSEVHIGAAQSAVRRCTTMFRFREGWVTPASGGAAAAAAAAAAASAGTGTDAAAPAAGGSPAADGATAEEAAGIGAALAGGQAAASGSTSSASRQDHCGQPREAAQGSRPTEASAHASGRQRGGEVALDADGDVIVKRHRIGGGTVAAGEQQGAAAPPDGSDSGSSSGGGGSGSHERTEAGGDDWRQGIIVHHAMATSLNEVWRCALLLGDLVLAHPELVEGKTVVELGAGCGVAGIAAARHARRVLLTDLPSLVAACRENTAANVALYAHGAAAVTVHGLDWQRPPLSLPCCHAAAREAPGGGAGGTAGGGRGDAAKTGAAELDLWAAAHGWSVEALTDLQQAQVFLAADTVYDDDLTEAFMATAAALLQPSASCCCDGACRGGVNSLGGGGGNAAAVAGGGSWKRMYVSLEKRYNFTLQDKDARASAYDYWRTLFTAQPAATRQEDAASCVPLSQPADCNGFECSSTDGSPAAARSDDGAGASSSLTGRIVGRRLDAAAVPRVLEFERDSNLELWELWRPH